MDIVPQPYKDFTATYLDGVLIHSFHLREVLTGLQKAGLTANTRKCRIWLNKAQYLGYCIGRVYK